MSEYITGVKTEHTMKMYTNKFAAFLFLAIIAGKAPAQNEVRVYENDIVLPTYPIHEPDLNPVFFRGRATREHPK